MENTPTIAIEVPEGTEHVIAIGHTPSRVTKQLVELLLERDGHGQQKYGTSLDRKDLSLTEWLQHQIEELLDGAGYAAAALRELQAQNQEYAILRKSLEQFLRNEERPVRYTYEQGHQAGAKATRERLRNLLLDHDANAVLRQVARQRT